MKLNLSVLIAGLVAGLLLAVPLAVADSAGATSQSAAPDVTSGATAKPPIPPEPEQPVLLVAGEERHLRNIRQLTFGHSPEFEAGAESAANYAEAYWAPDMRSLILQAQRNEFHCDQLYVLDLLSGGLRMVNNGEGRVTCGYYSADGLHCIYSGTAENGGAECPAPPDMSQGYVWPVYPTYDIYYADVATGTVLKNLTQHPGYDAEGTIDWNTGWLYFTSKRDNDLDVYRLNMNTGEQQRLTDSYGYDGGPFVSYDGQTVVYRHGVFNSDAERDDYTKLLSEDMIRPGRLELMAMNADGTGKRQLTNNGASNFAPFLHPDNQSVIFCSNLSAPGSRYFDLYLVPLAGGEPERVTFSDEFDGFPMFSPDGKYLVWCSNRHGKWPNETNVFIAEWIP